MQGGAMGMQGDAGCAEGCKGVQGDAGGVQGGAKQLIQIAGPKKIQHNASKIYQVFLSVRNFSTSDYLR